MSKTIEQRVKELKSKEEKLRLALTDNGDDLKEKAKSAGKIALITGLITLTGYLVYKAFFEAEPEEQEEPKTYKKIQRTQPSYGLTQRISAFAMPYITKLLTDYLELDTDKKDKED